VPRSFHVVLDDATGWAATFSLQKRLGGHRWRWTFDPMHPVPPQMFWDAAVIDAICGLEDRLGLAPSYPEEYQRRLTRLTHRMLREVSDVISLVADAPRLHAAADPDDPVVCLATGLIFEGVGRPGRDAWREWGKGTVACTARELLWVSAAKPLTVYRSLRYHVVAVHLPDLSWRTDEDDAMAAAIDETDPEEWDEWDTSDGIAARSTVHGTLSYPVCVELLSVTREPEWRADLWVQLDPESPVFEALIAS
jgi:hypothetical protein